MTDLIALFFIFAKVSLLTFGGGLASLPFLYEVFVTEKAWLTAGVFSETVALAQMTPGPIILNSATLLGYRFAGLAGSITGTVAVVVAPLLVVMALVWIFENRRGGAAGRGAVDGGAARAPSPRALGLCGIERRVLFRRPVPAQVPSDLAVRHGAAGRRPLRPRHGVARRGVIFRKTALA